MNFTEIERALTSSEDFKNEVNYVITQYGFDVLDGKNDEQKEEALVEATSDLVRGVIEALHKYNSRED